MTTSMHSFFEQKPANEYLQACCNTVVYSISFNDEQNLIEEYPLFTNFLTMQLRYFLAGIDSSPVRQNVKKLLLSLPHYIKNFPVDLHSF